MARRKTRYKKNPIQIDEGDLNADWIKYLRGGKEKKKDLKAHEDAQKMEDDRKKRRGE